MPPNLLRKSVPPTSASRRSAALTAAPPPVSRTPFSMVRTQALEVIMGMYQSIGTASDRVMATLMAGLELEFGRGAGEALAHRFLEAEETDFRRRAGQVVRRDAGRRHGRGTPDQTCRSRQRAVRARRAVARVHAGAMEAGSGASDRQQGQWADAIGRGELEVRPGPWRPSDRMTRWPQSRGHRDRPDQAASFIPVTAVSSLAARTERPTA